MQFHTSLVQPRLDNSLVQMCAFCVRVLAQLSGGLEAPLSNDGASVAMTTQFNREKLESMAYLDADGQGVIAARNFHADLPLFHWQNVWFLVCMDRAGNAKDAELLRTDKLGMQTVIYANTTASLAELMLERGQRWTTPLRLVESSSDEKNYWLVLELSPESTGTHYSRVNLAHVERISAQHILMALVAQALQACQE